MCLRTLCIVVAVAFVLLAVHQPQVEARPLSKIATEQAKRSFQKRLQKALTYDAARDAKTKAIQLQAQRKVFRYTTGAEARKALTSGLPAKTHTTTRVLRGRPLAGPQAQQRFGTRRIPTHRLTIDLSEGRLVKRNRVVGGTAGQGELLVMRRISPSKVVGDVRLRGGRLTPPRVAPHAHGR